MKQYLKDTGVIHTMYVIHYNLLIFNTLANPLVISSIQQIESTLSGITTSTKYIESNLRGITTSTKYYVESQHRQNIMWNHDIDII